MSRQLTFLLLLISSLGFAQTKDNWKKSAFIFTPEILLGKTMEAYDGFPELNLQKQIILSFGRDHSNNPQQWAQILKGPRTGMSVGITDFGNVDSLGIAIIGMPFIEFNAFGSNRFKVLTGLGASYFTEKFNEVTSPNNRAISTSVTWAFRLYLNYQFFSTKKVDWRAGLGYSHHSNGHTRLMNNGFNSFLLSLSADIKNPLNKSEENKIVNIPKFKNSVYDYISIRSGIGQNVFALAFNDKKNVYTIAAEYGKVYKNTFKIGIGFYYRFYQHYYDYIKEEESLVQPGREFDYFRSNPVYYASNIGVVLHGEVLLNHFGIDVQLGYNLHKPAYKAEWRINEGWDKTPREIPKTWVLGELNSKFKKKYRVSSRLGLKYYFLGMEKAPKNNFFIGAHLNSNLGQADFTEMSLGYIHRFTSSTISK